MAKRVVRYLLEGNGSVPLFIENGGYYPIGAELVGLAVDEDERHVPKTVKRMSRAELEARVTSLCKDAKGKFKKDSVGVLYSTRRIQQEVAAFLESLGVKNYE
jgi:hypothetical protein